MNDAINRIKSVKEYIKMPLLYNHWYIAGLGEEFSREPVGKTLLERSIVFYRTEAGELVALQNRCLHRSFPLSESYLEGDNIVCRYHGIRYNPEGEIARVPCQDMCPKNKLHKYPVKEMGPFVFIWMGDPDNPDMSTLPDLPFLEDPNYRTFHGYYDMQGNYLFMQENLNDLSHFAYLHKDTFKFDDGLFDLPVVIEETEEGISCNRPDKNWESAVDMVPPYIRETLVGKEVERWDKGVSLSPGVFKGYAPLFAGKEGDDDYQVFNSHVMHYLTPETSSTTHYWYSMSFDFAQDDEMFFKMMEPHIGKGFDEDKWAVGHMQNLLDNDHIDFKEMIIAADKPALMFRRRILNWAIEEYGDELANL